MGFDGSGTFIWTVVTLAAVAAAVMYAYMEYQVRMLRTTATKISTGLLFTSRFLTVSTRNASQEVVINAPFARYAADGSAVDIAQLPRRELSVALPALGLMCQVTPHTADKAQAVQRPADRCRIRFQTADAAKLKALGLPAAPVADVVIDSVPLPVGRAFQSFSMQMGLWIERAESRVHLEREAERRRQEEEIAAAAAALKAAEKAASKSGLPKEDYGYPVSDEVRQERIDKQVAALRASAGFKGSSSEFGADPGGKLQWFVDLDASGRVIFQSTGRSFSGSLKGAKITTLAGELEIGVRDALWSEDESQLSNFNIMAGAKPEVRLAWKERLEILIRSMR